MILSHIFLSHTIRICDRSKPSSPPTFLDKHLLLSMTVRDLRSFALCYIDDIIIFSESFEVHLSHLQRVFDALRDAHLIVKPTKCRFLQAKIRFLGHVVSAGIVEPDPEKTRRDSTLAHTKRSTFTPNRARIIQLLSQVCPKLLFNCGSPEPAAEERSKMDMVFSSSNRL